MISVRPRFVSRRVALAAMLALAAGAPVHGQGVHPLSQRPIARVMGHEGADWLERPEREREEEPDRALNAIGIRRGDTVADVGAGSGYFTIRLARRVGADGTVYATDIQREMLARLERRIKAEPLSNVRLVLGDEADPKLPAGALDLILMVNVYHELAQPQLMLQRLRAALKPRGRLVLLEYRKEDPTVPIRFEHKMSVAEAKQELEAEGFELERTSDVLPRQHILIFRAR